MDGQDTRERKQLREDSGSRRGTALRNDSDTLFRTNRGVSVCECTESLWKASASPHTLVRQEKEVGKAIPVIQQRPLFSCFING